MSEEQLSALLAKLRQDVVLQEKLKGAADLDAAVAIVKEAGFDVSKADLLKHQAKQTLALSDDELERIAGGCVNTGASHWGDKGQCGSAFTCGNTGFCDC